MKFVWRGIFLMACLIKAGGSDAFGISNIFGDVMGGVCSTIVAGTSFESCTVEFVKAIGVPIQQGIIAQEHPDDVGNRIRGTWKSCCATTALRSCIFGHIRDTCGDDAEKVSRGIMDQIYKGIAGDEDVSCMDVEFIYAKASPLCWEESKQIMLLGVLILLFLGCVCSAMCKSCCCRRKKVARVDEIHLIQAA